MGFLEEDDAGAAVRWEWRLGGSRGVGLVCVDRKQMSSKRAVEVNEVGHLMKRGWEEVVEKAGPATRRQKGTQACHAEAPRR
jgi:hypothetical protein